MTTTNQAGESPGFHSITVTGDAEGNLVTTVDPPEHKQVAGWGGGGTLCGMECACGTVFDGFDTFVEVREQLDRHIEDESSEPKAVMSDNEKLAAEQADGLRALADLIEANPQLNANLDRIYGFHPNSAEAQAAIARAGLRHGAKVDKDVWEKQHNIVLKWGPVHVHALASRETVCERVQVGEEKVTSTVPDPAVVVPTIEVTETVPVYEWRCAPILAAEGGVSS
jgi:hypothetical protein